MFCLTVIVFLAIVVDGDYIFTPVNNVARCSMNALINNQNVVIFYSVNNLCLINNSNIAIQSDVNQRKFSKDITNKVLLFKITAGFGQQAILFYRDNTAFNDSFVDWKNDANIFWYKNYLLKDMSKFKYVIVEVTNALSVPYAWLKFQVSNTDSAESWFKKDTLVDAYPWNAASIKETFYPFFSVEGVNEFYACRRTFHIYNYMVSCATGYGIIGVIEHQDYCGYVTGNGEKQNDYTPFQPPKIVFYNTTASNGVYTVLAFATNLRIIGVLKDEYYIYY